jgi:hypothetical protein
MVFVDHFNLSYTVVKCEAIASKKTNFNNYENKSPKQHLLLMENILNVFLFT